VAAALAFIFWLLWVLKNTFDITENVLDLVVEKIPRNLNTAYDGKYYPATVIASVKYDCEAESVITDFSLYETKQIVGFTICTPQSITDYYGPLAFDLDDEELRFLEEPTIFTNVVVYAPREGIWTWKPV
jgi:hypothetical protein